MHISDVIRRLRERGPLKSKWPRVDARAYEARADDMETLPPDIRSRLSRLIEDVIHLCESPIEQTALYQMAGCNFGSVDDPIYATVQASSLERDGNCRPYQEAEIVIVPQVSIGRFRLDFILYSRSGRRLAVECDGRDYHDQSADEARDYDLLTKHNLLVFRVTGREIWRGNQWTERLLDRLRRERMI